MIAGFSIEEVERAGHVSGEGYFVRIIEALANDLFVNKFRARRQIRGIVGQRLGEAELGLLCADWPVVGEVSGIRDGGAVKREVRRFIRNVGEE